MFRTIVIAALGAASLNAPTAQAAVYSGSATDPADDRVASMDIRAVSTTVDNGAGTWSTTVGFRGARTAKTLSYVYLSFDVPANAQGFTQGGFVRLKLHGRKTTWLLHNESLGANDGKQNDLVKVTWSGKQMTVVVTDPRLIGVSPAHLNLSASYQGRNRDKVDPLDLTAAP